MKRHFERQADYCTAFGAELTARLLRLLPDCISARRALGQRIAHWPGDPAPEADNLPWRGCGLRQMENRPAQLCSWTCGLSKSG